VSLFQTHLDSDRQNFLLDELTKRHDVITTVADSQIICRWEAQSYTVYYALINDFMKPRIEEVGWNPADILLLENGNAF
jgi:hypothetical protein